MEDVVLKPAEITLAVLEERKEEEEDRRREGCDVNKEKCGHPTAYREFVERIKENLRKLEEKIALLVVEALGLNRLRFVKAETKAEADKQHSVEPEVCGSSSSNDGSSDRAEKDEKQAEISTNDLETNEESGREGSSIDLEKEEEEEEDDDRDDEGDKEKEEEVIEERGRRGIRRGFEWKLAGLSGYDDCDRGAGGAVAERERIVGKPVEEGMIQPDGTMSIKFIGERLFVRKEKKRERRMWWVFGIG
ncbi:uncharacterized protein MONOS_16070 [Monocercomonoides exilis]|uniref:uncharacterized protein n=1 Tax=Monocercomonoides exilis TaxID=2049356 RepID=UPI00355A5768|nr:hypothetical protein MONOS_16070 [Monocercomonoides exilis]|eukprot:MONOS_16070.1-p1 / transcript=MONOS_16070.1 / gene=MONOS_16070 / organism=Monocercomonoides_exilis_PA203 / gene_product=unspecified product / transcript_product=unspecified product / location=Mono_scaffold01490:4259-5122(+) / protein_length=248 / sequence_SO=supercontig / SO=protein_coding / is_pseudo=false